MSGWEELRREIEALPVYEKRGGPHAGDYLQAAPVLAIVDRAALSGSTAPLDRLVAAAEDLVAELETEEGFWWQPQFNELRDALDALSAASPDPAQGGERNG